MSKDAIKLAADAHVDLIPPPYDELYRALGYDNFALFFHYFGGQYVYVPTLRNVLSGPIKSQASKESLARGDSLVQLARKYGYSGQYLRKVLSGE